jgi:TP901 family phage tail tape measure protein
VSAGVAAVKLAGDYQQSMNVLQAVTKASASQMKDFGTKALALGADLTLPATSAKDAADAMTELAKGGLSVTQTMKAAKGVLQLSAAATISNAEAATITARALKGFSLGGNEAIRVADVLANAANKSTGDITDFAAGLSDSAAVAHSYGLTINETTAALMGLADAGIVGADGGTTLKTMLLRLTPTTKAAKDAFKELGIDTYNAKGQFVGISSVIGQFHTALAKLTPEQRQQALATIFGSRAIRGANILLGDGVKAFQNYLHATQQQGAAADLAAAKMKGFKGALGGLQSQLETLAIAVGLKLLPALTDALNVVNKVLGAKTLKLRFEIVTAGLKGGFEKIRAFFLGKTIPLKLDMGGTGRGETQHVAGLVEKIASAFESVNWSRVAATVGTGIAGALATSTVMFARLSQTMTVAIGAAIMGIDFEALGTKMGPGLLTMLLKAVATIGDPAFIAHHIGDIILAALMMVPLDGIAAAFGLRFVRIFTYPLAALGKLLIRIGADLAGLFVEGFLRMLGVELGVLSGILARIGGLFRGIIPIITGAIRAAALGVGHELGDMVATGARLAGQFVARVGSIIRGLFQPVELGMRMAFDAIRNRAASWLSAGVLLGSRLIRGVVTGLENLAAAVIGKIRDLWAILIGAAGSAYAYAFRIGSQIVQGVLGGLGGLYGAVKGKVEGVLGAVLGSLNIPGGSPPEHAAAEKVGKPLAKGIVEGFLLGWANYDLPSKMSDKIRAALERAQQTVQGMQGRFSTAWGRLAGDALRAFDAVTDSMIGKLNAKLDRWTAHLNAVADAQLARIAATQAEETPAEAQLKAEQAARAAAARAQEIIDKQKALAEAQTGGDPAAILAAQKALDDALLAEHIAALEAQATVERAAKDKAAEEDRARVEKERTAAQTIANNLIAEQIKQLQAQRDLRRRHFEDMLTEMEQALEKNPEKWKKMHAALQGLFKTFGVDFKTSGKMLGEAFADGMEEAFDKVEKTAKAIAALVAKYLPHSPAEKGPLSKLPDWETYLVGSFDAGAIGRALASRAETALALGAGGPGVSRGPSALASTGTGGLTVNVYLTGGVIGTADEVGRYVAGGVKKALSEKIRLGGAGIG